VDAVVKTLAGLRGDPVVTSLYLDVDGRRWPRRSEVEGRLQALGRRAAKEAVALGAPAEAEVLDHLGRVAEWFETFDRSGVRGVVLFADGDGLHTFTLAVPVADDAVVRERAHLAPLVEALAADVTVLTVLVDRQRGRLLRCGQGRADELTGIFDAIPRKVEPRAEEVSYVPGLEEGLRAHMRRLAGSVEAEVALGAPEAILLSGPHDAVAALEAELDPSTADLVASRLTLGIHASRDSVIRAVSAVVGALTDARAQGNGVEVRDAVGAGSAVCGLEAVADALSAQRVDRLVIARGAQGRGSRCRDCGHLDRPHPKACVRCGGVTAEVDDVVDEALVQALAGGATVIVADSGAVADGLGAHLRY
jgi:hypothetical protein